MRLLATLLASLLAALPATAVAQPLPPPPGEQPLPPPPGESNLPPPPGEQGLPPPPGETGVPTQVRPGDALADAQAQARTDVDNEGVFLWAAISGGAAFAVGAAVCCFTALYSPVCSAITCAGVTGLGYGLGVDPPMKNIVNRDARYQAAYIDEYRSGMKFKRAKYAFIGGAIGTVVIAGLALAVVALNISLVNNASGNSGSGSGSGGK